MHKSAAAALLGAAMLGTAAPALAQGGLGLSLGQPVDQFSQSALRTIDDERLFRESRFGERVMEEIEVASRALEAENDRLLAELSARESELTERRSEMSPEEFREAASEFDQQAEEVRRTQAEKRQRLTQFEESERRRFFSETTPVLQDLLDAEGGQILIDARAVVIARVDVDITDEAITAIDESLGDGGPPPFPLSLP